MQDMSGQHATSWAWVFAKALLNDVCEALSSAAAAVC